MMRPAVPGDKKNENLQVVIWPLQMPGQSARR